MKTLLLSPQRAIRTIIAVLMVMLAWAEALATQPRLTPLLRGKWPQFSRGNANDVKVVGHYAYVALGRGGLTIVDVSNPAAPRLVGGYDTSGSAHGVAVADGYAYVADGSAGL